jgi:hypothetical protein
LDGDFQQADVVVLEENRVVFRRSMDSFHGFSPLPTTPPWLGAHAPATKAALTPQTIAAIRSSGAFCIGVTASLSFFSLKILALGGRENIESRKCGGAGGIRMEVLQAR